MRVNLKASSQFPVISSKQQVTSPQSQVLSPYLISRHQGEILKIPRSKFQVPRSKFQERKGNGEFGKSSAPACVGLWFIAPSWSQ